MKRKSKPALTSSQERDLCNRFQTMIKERSMQCDGSESYGYQAGFSIGFLNTIAFIPEVQEALQVEIDRWEREKAS